MSFSRVTFGLALTTVLLLPALAAAEVVLGEPADGYHFKLYERRSFLWQAEPDDPGPFISTLSVARILDGQLPAQALAENPRWYEVELPRGAVTVPHPGAPMGHTREAKLTAEDHNAWFAWQVSLWSEAKGTYASEVRTFHTPFVADFFTAASGDCSVTVTDTVNNDITQLIGTATVRCPGYPPIAADFDAITLEDRINYFVLLAGQLTASAPGTVGLQAPPPSEGTGTFAFEAFRCTKDNVWAEGSFAWEHPGFGKITTDPAWVAMSDGQPSDVITLGHPQALLVDDAKLQFTLNAASYFSLGENQFYPYLDVTIASAAGPKLSVSFQELESLDYAEAQPASESQISPLANGELVMVPTTASLDFSADATPISVSEPAAWQGLVFHDMQVQHRAPAHSPLQTPPLVASGTAAFSEGILAMDLRAPLDDSATVLGFPVTDAELVLKSSSADLAEESGIAGQLHIPYLDADYGFVIPITKAGLGDPELVGDDVPEGLVLRDAQPRIVWFELDGEVGRIDHEQGTIVLDVPSDFSTRGVAKFIAIGKSVTVDDEEQVSSQSKLDFGSRITYQITAFDGSSADYVVKLMRRAPVDDGESPPTAEPDEPRGTMKPLPASQSPREEGDAGCSVAATHDRQAPLSWAFALSALALGAARRRKPRAGLSSRRP